VSSAALEVMLTTRAAAGFAPRSKGISSAASPE
jgi:hypothetical protein